MLSNVTFFPQSHATKDHTVEMVMGCAAISLLCTRACSIIAVYHLAKNLNGVRQRTTLILIKNGDTAPKNNVFY